MLVFRLTAILTMSASQTNNKNMVHQFLLVVTNSQRVTKLGNKTCHKVVSRRVMLFCSVDLVMIMIIIENTRRTVGGGFYFSVALAPSLWETLDLVI